MVARQVRLVLLVPAAAGLGALAFCLPAASQAQPRGAGDEAVQVLADIVLIESRCRQLAVDYGRLFAFAERSGISPVDIMPAGDRRAAFEAATARRERDMTAEHLCGDLAAERAAEIPGVFTQR